MAALSGRPRRWRLALASSGLVVLLAVASGAMLGWLNSARPLQQLPASRWAMADPALMQAGSDWPAYGGTYSARRYSPLAQITPANVGKLEQNGRVSCRERVCQTVENTEGHEELKKQRS